MASSMFLHFICNYKTTVWVKKIPREVLWQFSQNADGGEFFDQILHAYYAFLSMLDCEFLFS